MTVWLSPGSCTCGPCPVHRVSPLQPFFGDWTLATAFTPHPATSALAEQIYREQFLGMNPVHEPDTHCTLCGTDYAGASCPGCKGDSELFGEPL